MPEATPDGYVRICLHRRRGRAHLALSTIALTTVCGLVIPWHTSAKENSGWVFDERNQRNICTNCKKKQVARDQALSS